MKKQLPEILFRNKDNPRSYFQIVKIEDLLTRELGHDICKNHLVKFYVIFFIYEGQGYHTIDFTDYNYKEGTVLLVRKDQVHKFFRSPNVKGYLLIFTEEFIISHLNKLEVLKSMQLFNDSLSYPKIEFDNMEEFNDFARLIKRMEDEHHIQDDFSIGITRSVLHIVIAKLFRIRSESGHLVDSKKYMSQFLEFQALVEKECFYSRNVQYYASKMGITAKTLNNISSEVINNSPKAFIDGITIMHIKRLLIATDYPVKEIAYKAGFSDPTNFYKYFKKYSGSSPEVFRQAH